MHSTVQVLTEYFYNLHTAVQVLTGDFCNQFKKTITHMAVLLCVHSTVQLLTEDFCNQFRDFSSLSGKVYTYLLIFTQHFHSDTFFHNYIILLQKSSTKCGANYTYQSNVTTTQHKSHHVPLNIS